MRVQIDLEKCNGYGSCVAAAPAFFEMDDSGSFAVVRNENPQEDMRAVVSAAVRVCPTHAISIVEEGGRGA